MRRTRAKPTITFKVEARINHQIRVPEVRVISAEGKQVGIMKTSEALGLAQEQGLDLVEVSPVAQPPVVKLINFDKYRYQQEKLAQSQKKHQKKVDIKGIRLSMRIGQHDMEVKARQADKFLTAGNKVKIELRLRGRERAVSDVAHKQIEKFSTMIKAPTVVEQPVKQLGGFITTILAPKK